jgi:hypothetical protein
MSDCPPFRDLPKDKVNSTIPPLFLAKLTGVAMAQQNRTGDVKLTYTDHSEETGRLDYDITEEESFFKIVGDVQAAARQEVSQ